MKMDLNKLRYFQQIARMKSFTRAATELHVAQPALSKQMAKLEKEFGVKLFNRIGRKTELTDAGRILFYHINRTLDQFDRAKAEIRENSRLGRGELRLGSLNSISDYILPTILTNFVGQYPNIDVLLETGSLDTLTAQVLENKLEAAIVALPVIHSRLHTEIFFEEEFVLAVPVGHPWAKEEFIDLQQLDDKPLIIPPFRTWSRNFVGLVFEQHNIHFSIRAEIGSYPIIKQMISQGVEVGLVPEIVMEEPPPGTVMVRIKNRPLKRQIAWAYHEKRELSPVFKEFRSLTTRLYTTLRESELTN
jgi:DNA-binding transcriptional LysR family regulator